MLLLERLQVFRDSKDQYEDAWDTQDWIQRELEAALIAQCVQRDRPILRKRSRSEAKRLLEALREVFYIIEDVEDLERDKQALLDLGKNKNVRIIDLRTVKNRFDDVLVVIQ